MNKTEINIGGQNRSFIFGLGFLGDILEHFDTDITGLGRMMEKNPYKCIPAIIYFGHAYYLKKKGDAVMFSMMDVDGWIEDMEDTYAHPDIEKLLTVLLDSMRKNVPGMKEVEAKESKKKLTGT